MKYKQDNTGFTKILLQQLWVVILLCNFFISSGFVTNANNQTPHIVQTELLVSVTNKHIKSTFFYALSTRFFNFKSQQNYKNLIILHNTDTKRMLVNRFKIILSFKNNTFLRYHLHNTGNAYEEMPQIS